MGAAEDLSGFSRRSSPGEPGATGEASSGVDPVDRCERESNPGSLRVGDVVAGRYRCDRLLGAGGMGLVFRSSDRVLGRSVAIKVMRSEAASDPISRERFLREARSAARLTSEHTARVLDVGQLGSGVPFIVFEYLDGEDLASRLERTGAIPAVEAVTYLLQACEALTEAHAEHLVHRDLKPENLFLARTVDGTISVKVLDFGVAKSLTWHPGSLALTGPANIVGTPNYMAPEQLRGEQVDARTDIWALGAILYELLTGRVAFEGESLMEVCAKVLAESPHTFAPVGGLPPALEAIVRRCLSADPRGRFGSVAELSEALKPHAATGSDQTSACNVDERRTASSASFSSRRMPYRSRIAVAQFAGVLFGLCAAVRLLSPMSGGSLSRGEPLTPRASRPFAAGPWVTRLSTAVAHRERAARPKGRDPGDNVGATMTVPPPHPPANVRERNRELDPHDPANFGGRR